MDVEQLLSEPSSEVPDLVWCPSCRAEIDHRGGVGPCPFCGGVIDMDLARQASRVWIEHVELQRTLENLNESINQLTQRRATVRDHLHDAAARYSALRAEALATGDPSVASTAEPQQVAEAAVPEPGYVAEAAAPEPRYVAEAPASEPRVRGQRVPMALLLQGTGAVLVLAALVVVSAVLWGTLPGGMQLSLLGASVGVIGALAILTKKMVPTTSTVLAVLTAAALIVVLIAAPALIADWQTSLYPGVAGVVFSGVSLLSGRLLRVRVWWLFGIASVPITVTLLALSGMGSLAAPADPQWAVAVVSALVAATAAGMSWWAAVVVRSDRQTSVTAWVASLIAAFLVWATASVMGAIAYFGLAFTGFGEKVPHLLVLGCAAGLAAAMGPAGVRAQMWRGEFARIVAVGFAAAGLTVMLLPPMTSLVVALGVGAAVVAVVALALFGLVRLPTWAVALQTGVWAFFGSVFFALSSGAMWTESFGSAYFAEPQFVSEVSRQLEQRQWAWLAATVAGVGVGVALLTAGLLRRSTWLVVVAVPVAGAAWWLCYETGLSSPEPFEIAWLPAATFALAAVWLGHQRGVLRRIPVLAVVLVAAVPSGLVAVSDIWLIDGRVGLRALAVVAVLALVVVASARRLVVVPALALGLALAVPWAAWIVWAIAEASRLPAVVTVPTALVAIAVHAQVVAPGKSVARWWSVVQWPLTFVVSVTALWAVLNPFWNAEVLAQTRVVLVVVAAVAVAIFRWTAAPIVAMVAGWVAVFVTWVSVMNAVSSDAQVWLEWFTLPSAAALGALIALAVHGYARGSKSAAASIPSLATFGPPLVLALLPSAVAAVADLAGEGGILRFWLVLVSSAVLVVVGSIRNLAGVLVPALLAMVVVVFPLLLDVVESLPLWVPLVAVGVALLVIGARFEHVRRRGHVMAGWIAHLH